MCSEHHVKKLKSDRTVHTTYKTRKSFSENWKIVQSEKYERENSDTWTFYALT